MKTRRIISQHLRSTLVALVVLCSLSLDAQAQMWGGTVLADITQSGNSQIVEGVATGRTQLSDGSAVPFRPWYSPSGQDVHVTMLTPLDDNFGLLWGFGTGEAGEKYQIDPSLRIGMISSVEVGRSSTLSFRASLIVGGFLTESPCAADYGAIGGVQSVNCRLAATPLRPAETLDHLFNEAPPDHYEVSVTYQLKF